MAQISSHLRSVRTYDGTGIAFWCPACEHMHVVKTSEGGHVSPWAWDGELTTPTISPSVRVLSHHDDPPVPMICHFNVDAGVMTFHGDCTHALRGTKVSLPELPRAYQDPTSIWDDGL